MPAGRPSEYDPIDWDQIKAAQELMDSMPIPDKGVFYKDGKFYAFDGESVERIDIEQAE